MHRIVRLFLKCLLLVLRGKKILNICCLGQRFQWKKKQMGNFVVVKHCEVCTFQKKKTLANKEGSNTYKIREGLHLDYNSEKVIYLITCKKCQKQYAGSCITRFRTRFNKYRSCHRKFCRGHSVIEVSFQADFIIDKELNKQETKKNNSKSNKIV